MARLSKSDRSAILARMPDIERVKRDAERLDRDITSRPTITRSDAAARALVEAGLGVSRVVAEIDAALRATRTVSVLVGRKGPDRQFKTQEVPDWPTRDRARRDLIEIQGLLYSPQKSQDIPPIALWLQQLPQDAYQRVEGIIRDRLMPLFSPRTGGNGAN